MSNIVDFLHQRGFVDNMTSEDLKKAVSKPIRAYIGFDPTADSLHLGNLVGIVAFAWLQRFGHTPVVVIGGGTAKIGDPSGKSLERPLLDLEIMKQNAQAIWKQCSQLLGQLDSKVKPVFIDNDEWLSSHSLLSFLRDIGKHFRLGPMLGKESVRSRLHSEEGISLTEFFYQVLQAYDFYYLFHKHQVQLQLGGSDQWGNITAGVELVRKMLGETVFGLTYPLLTRSDGVKFGKTEGGAIWLNPEKTSPYQFYQYLIQVPDADVTRVMRLLTVMEEEEILSFEKAFREGSYTPRAAQRRLAEEVTCFVHGEEKLELAKRVTAAAAPGSQAKLDPDILREIAYAMPSVSLQIKEVLFHSFVELAVRAKLVTSKSEANRLIKNGGAYLNNYRIESPSFTINEENLIGGEYLLIGSGKKKKILVKVIPS